MKLFLKLWYKIGLIAYQLLLPVVKVYAARTKPRTRVLIVCNNDILLVKNWLSNGCWALPGGGMESGEEPAEAAIREIHEELNLTIPAVQLESLGLHDSIGNDGLKSSFYLFVFTVDTQPNISLRPYEIMDANWQSVTHILSDQNYVSRTVQDAVRVWMKSKNLVS